MSKASDLIQTRPPKILLMGKWGSGKTALAMSLGEKAEMLDLENGVYASRIEDQWKTQRENVNVEGFYDTTPGQATAWARLKSHVDKIAVGIQQKKWNRQALIIDSLTAVQEISLNFVMANSGKLGKQPEIQHWGMNFNEMANLLQQLRALPIPVIVLAHVVQTIENESVKLELAVPGKANPQKIPGMFTEVLYCKVETGAANKTRFLLQSKPSGLISCRSSSQIEDNYDMTQGMDKLIEKMGWKWKEETKETTTV